MNIVFRADASTIIGTGHVMRCLTLAQELQAQGHQVSFICREYPGNLINFIQQKKIAVHVLPFAEAEAYANQAFSNDYQKWLWLPQAQDAQEVTQALAARPVDWLVVDHYALDINWESQLRKLTKKIMAIDDLANRTHDCDLLLDQNYYVNFFQRYDQLVPANCKKLLGPKYALLRAEFFAIKAKRKALHKVNLHTIKRILVCLGGTDFPNMTQKVLENLLSWSQVKQYEFDVVVGIANPHRQSIQQFCQQYDFFHYHCQPSYYNELLINADLAIAAGGSSTYERCLILLPSMVFAIAENQVKLAEDLATLGVHVYVGLDPNIAYFEVLTQLEKNLAHYVEKMEQLVDGNGLQRVSAELLI